MSGYEAVQTAQSFAYEIRGNSAVILRCFLRDGRVEIPEHIGGYPVTELGAYAFSAHFEEKQVVFPPALCGEQLEEIALPATIRRVGRYCFYNCGNLRRIEFHGELSDWGSGAFTGCHGVRNLRVYTDADGRAHLKDVLDELREELEVEYFTGTAGEDRAIDRISGDRDGGLSGTHSASGFARLIFPEFYEEGVENTPARILENHVHGSGILYRNCFRGRALDFAQYDALFPHAKAWESGELVLRMALARLRSGQGLTQKSKEQYEQYLTEHAAEAGSWLLGQRDLEGVQFLLSLAEQGKSGRGTGGDGEAKDGAAGKTDESTPSTPGQRERRIPDTLVQTLLEEASRMQYMEAVSFLMEYGHVEQAGRPARRRRLEL